MKYTIVKMWSFGSRWFRSRGIKATALAVVGALCAGLPLISVLAGVPERTFRLTAESPKFWKLFDRDAKLTRVAGDFGFTEGPVWDEAGFIYVSDEVQNKIYRVFTGWSKRGIDFSRRSRWQHLRSAASLD